MTLDMYFLLFSWLRQLFESHLGGLVVVAIVELDDDFEVVNVVLDAAVLDDVLLDDVVLDAAVLDVVLNDVVLDDVVLDDAVLDDVVLDDVVLDVDVFEVELVLELLDVTVVPPTAISSLPEMTYTRLLPNIGRWNFARPTVPGTVVIGSSTPPVGTARKADSP